MKERPILFNASMVRAILDGRKTQTRRFITMELCDRKKHPVAFETDDIEWILNVATRGTGISPLGVVGDRLWVRENWQTYQEFDKVKPRDLSPDTAIQYPATYDGWDSRVRPSIYMPRWASRISLEVKAVRLERLQDITEDDAKAEGAEIGAYYPGSTREPATYREAFEDLWKSVYGAETWDANPWIWVAEFERVGAE